MPSFMLDRHHCAPPDFAARCCVLVRYRLPLLRHCYVLCHAPEQQRASPAEADILAFFLAQAHRLAFEAVGDKNAFVLIYSGSAIRKRANVHLHVFVVPHRWQKAWLYSVLAIKNFALAAVDMFDRKRRH